MNENSDEVYDFPIFSNLQIVESEMLKFMFQGKIFETVFSIWRRQHYCRIFLEFVKIEAETCFSFPH